MYCSAMKWNGMEWNMMLYDVILVHVIISVDIHVRTSVSNFHSNLTSTQIQCKPPRHLGEKSHGRVSFGETLRRQATCHTLCGSNWWRYGMNGFTWRIGGDLMIVWNIHGIQLYIQQSDINDIPQNCQILWSPCIFEVPK